MARRPETRGKKKSTRRPKAREAALPEGEEESDNSDAQEEGEEESDNSDAQEESSLVLCYTIQNEWVNARDELTIIEWAATGSSSKQ
eukprot:213184-Amphidinium_carterae.2